MSFRAVIGLAIATVAYWYFAGDWTSDASYRWAAHPKFGITDQMSPWPWRIVIVGYLAVVTAFMITIRAKRRRRRAL
jgi:hypothetical protein